MKLLLKFAFSFLVFIKHLSKFEARGVLPIMAYTGRLRPKGVLFSGFRYEKE